MKEYPTISSDIRHGVPVYVFPKYDGSCVRAEYSQKRDFYKFGKRHGLLDDTNQILAKEVPELIMEQAEKLYRVFKEQHWNKVIAFFEFWGDNSFAGNHEKETHRVSLIDVFVHPKGIVEPKLFVKFFEELAPPVIHCGNFTTEIQQQVRDGIFPGMSFEGIVAKGSLEKPGLPLMFKCKSTAWLQKLRKHCGGNEQLFNRLK